MANGPAPEIHTGDHITPPEQKQIVHRWNEISAALNAPVKDGPSNHAVAQQIAEDAIRLAQSDERARQAFPASMDNANFEQRQKDLADMRQAITAMQGSNPDQLRGTLAEANRLIAQHGLKFAQTSQGEIWEGDKSSSSDSKYHAAFGLATDPWLDALENKARPYRTRPFDTTGSPLSEPRAGEFRPRSIPIESPP